MRVLAARAGGDVAADVLLQRRALAGRQVRHVKIRRAAADRSLHEVRRELRDERLGGAANRRRRFRRTTCRPRRACPEPTCHTAGRLRRRSAATLSFCADMTIGVVPVPHVHVGFVVRRGRRALRRDRHRAAPAFGRRGLRSASPRRQAASSGPEPAGGVIHDGRRERHHALRRPAARRSPS